MDTDYIFELRLKNGKHIIKLTKTTERKFFRCSNFRQHEAGVESLSRHFFFYKFKLTILTKIKEEIIFEPEVKIDRNPSKEKIIANMGKQIMDEHIREIRKLLEDAARQQLQNTNR